jgi:hypothetical protein
MEEAPHSGAGGHRDGGGHGGGGGGGTRHTKEHGAGHTTMLAQYSAAGEPVLVSGAATKRAALKSGQREAMEAAGVTVPAGSVGDQRKHSHQPISGVNAQAYSSAAGAPGDAAAREATKELLGAKAGRDQVRGCGRATGRGHCGWMWRRRRPPPHRRRPARYPRLYHPLNSQTLNKYSK